ncbi:MAG TPA: LysR family transcriptional regulator [Polyangiaceae bacterium]
MKIRSDLFAGVLPFVRAAEEKSFGRAAASLGVTTAAVSKAVKKLEEDLGVRLLDRSSRVVSLTREGEVFLERCQSAVLSVRGARDAIEGIRSEPRGTVRVTIPIVLAPIVVTSLPRIASQYPRLSFRFDVTDRVAKLSGDGYDVAVRMGELEDSTLVARLLRRTRWVTVASPSYVARRGMPKTPEDLAQHDCLGFVGPKGKPVDWTFHDGKRARTIATSGALLVDHGASLLDGAKAGLGVAQILDFMIGDALETGALVEVLASSSARGPDVRAVTTQARARSANTRAFVDFLVDAFR